MTEMGDLHVVIGASGATGRLVVRELAAKGGRSGRSTAAAAPMPQRG